MRCSEPGDTGRPPVLAPAVGVEGNRQQRQRRWRRRACRHSHGFCPGCRSRHRSARGDCRAARWLRLSWWGPSSRRVPYGELHRVRQKCSRQSMIPRCSAHRLVMGCRPRCSRWMKGGATPSTRLPTPLPLRVLTPHAAWYATAAGQGHPDWDQIFSVVQSPSFDTVTRPLAGRLASCCRPRTRGVLGTVTMSCTLMRCLFACRVALARRQSRSLTAMPPTSTRPPGARTATTALPAATTATRKAPLTMGLLHTARCCRRVCRAARRICSTSRRLRTHTAATSDRPRPASRQYAARGRPFLPVLPTDQRSLRRRCRHLELQQQGLAASGAAARAAQPRTPTRRT